MQLELEKKYSKYNQNTIVWNDIQPLAYKIWDRGLELLEGLSNPENTLKQILITSTQWVNAMPLVSAGAQMSYLFEKDYPETEKAIEMSTRALVILAELDFYDIYFDKNSYRISSNIELEESTTEMLDTLMYLPPMVSKPNLLRNNSDSPLYSIDEKLILGHKNNYHENDISLDVLNIQNSIKWELDEEYLANNKEDISMLAYPEIYEKQYNNCLEEIRKVSYFYITNSVDKRGRIYTNGYHINPQGNSFHKAMLNFSEKEVCI